MTQAPVLPTIITDADKPGPALPMECSPGSQSMCEKIKYFCSFFAVHLLILVVIACVSMQYCTLQIHPIGLFILLILTLTWLAYVEGLHYGVVALEKRDMTEYELAFPRAFKTHKVVNTTAKVSTPRTCLLIIARIRTHPNSTPELTPCNRSRSF